MILLPFIIFCFLVIIYGYPPLKSLLKKERDTLRERYASIEEYHKMLRERPEETPPNTDAILKESKETLDFLEEKYRLEILAGVKQREKENDIALERIISKSNKEWEKKMSIQIIDCITKDLLKKSSSDAFLWSLDLFCKSKK